MSFSISTVFQSLVAVAKADAAKDLLPLVVKFADSVAANPTAINLVAQSTAFQAGVVAVLPSIAQDELVAFAKGIDAEAQALLAPASAGELVTPSKS